MARTCAVLLHGAGSTGAFMASAFEPAALGVDEVITPDHRDGIEVAIDQINRAVSQAHRVGLVVSAVGGVSLGAHAAALWAVRTGWHSGALVLAMPAWTGPPDVVATATAATAAEISRDGSGTIVSRLKLTAPNDWVVQAVSDAWNTYDDRTLATALSAASISPGPTISELQMVQAMSVVLALTDDPLHPSEVAAQWAAHIPSSVLVELPRDLDGVGVTRIGRAAGEALRALTAASESR